MVKLASKASRRVVILRRTKTFLGTSDLTTYKAFIRSLMEYCSPLWAGAPASHLSWLHAMETKAFRIIGISCDEAESLGLTLSPQAGRWSFCLLQSPICSPSPLPPTLSEICPPHISAGHSTSASNPLLVKLPKSRITAHLHSFITFFLLHLE